MSKPVRQHTVPCSYLQGFWKKPNWRDTELFMLNVQDWKPMKGKASSMTIINDFYTLKWVNGEKNYMIEDFFACYVEKGFSKVVAKIEKKENLTNDEMEYISQFIIFQEMRSKRRRDWDIEQTFVSMFIREIVVHCETQEDRLMGIKNALKEYYTYTATDDEALIMLEKFHKQEKILFEPREHFMKEMITVAPGIAKYIRMKQWVFLHAPKNRSYIVSDYPIYLHAWDKCLFWSPWYGTADFVWFPISKKVYLMPWDMVGIHQAPWHKLVKDCKIVQLLNYCTAYLTDRWLIWEDGALLSSVHKKVSEMDRQFILKRDWWKQIVNENY